VREGLDGCACREGRRAGVGVGVNRAAAGSSGKLEASKAEGQGSMDAGGLEARE
jgi:hypothetical protein